MPLSKNDYNIIITKIALTEDTNRRPGNEAKDSVLSLVTTLRPNGKCD